MERVFSSSQKLLPKLHTRQETNIHVLSGIRKVDPRNKEGANPFLRGTATGIYPNFFFSETKEIEINKNIK